MKIFDWLFKRKNKMPIILDENGQPETDDMLLMAVDAAWNSPNGDAVMFTRDEEGNITQVLPEKK